MRDIGKPCHHTLSEDVVYKEVVVIGNGPSGIASSFMLSGYVPYLREIPQDIPIDEMLRARLENIPKGQSLYEVDLMALAEGLEGRSQNPVPLLMDSLLKPCADLGLHVDSLIEWRYEVEKQIDHIVLGRGPPGGSWHSFEPNNLTLSPGSWLAMPPHQSIPGCDPADRALAKNVANYYRRYVRQMGLQRYFHSGVMVTGVVQHSSPLGAPCDSEQCPLNARWLVTGYDTIECRPVRYVCAKVVLGSGAGDRPNTLPACGASRLAIHSLPALERALTYLTNQTDPVLPVLVVGSGLSGADAVCATRRRGIPTLHAHRTPPQSLANLSPTVYPDYAQVYKMMREGASGNYENYSPLRDFEVIEITLLDQDLPYKTPTTERSSDFLDIDLDTVKPKLIKMLNVVTNEVKYIRVSVVAVLIGSKPDLHFLAGNFELDFSNEAKDNNKKNSVCVKCQINQFESRRKSDSGKDKQCFFKNHWLYFKSVLGQSIQSCKNKYWDVNYTEINGNEISECYKKKCKQIECNLDNGVIKSSLSKKCDCKTILSTQKCDCNTIKLPKTCDNRDLPKKCDCKSCLSKKCDCKPSNLTQNLSKTCECQPSNPYSSGLGFGIDPSKEVDCRTNPIAIDKSSHEVINGLKGMYALGPLTSDNFVRFISGGAFAIVAHIHKDGKEMEDYKKNIVNLSQAS